MLESVPEDVDADEVSGAVVAVPGVFSVHDLYIWVLMTWAVVRCRFGGRSRWAAAPVPQSESFKFGELVHVNVSGCAPELRKRVSAG